MFGFYIKGRFSHYSMQKQQVIKQKKKHHWYTLETLKCIFSKYNTPYINNDVAKSEHLKHWDEHFNRRQQADFNWSKNIQLYDSRPAPTGSTQKY